MQRTLFPELNPLIDPSISADTYSQTQNNSLVQNSTTAARLSSPDNIRTQEKTRGLGQSPKIHTSLDMLKSHIMLLEAILATQGNIHVILNQVYSDKKQALRKALREANGLEH